VKTACRIYCSPINEERVVPVDIGCEPSSVSDEVVLQHGWATYLVMEAVSSGHHTDLGNATIKFAASAAKYGYPNDEGLPEHPLYAKGLSESPSAVNEVLNSAWVREISNQKARSQARIWGARGMSMSETDERPLRHFIFCPKEGTFECVCRDFSITHSRKSIREIVKELVSSEPEA
jgi:hypothetical protein